MGARETESFCTAKETEQNESQHTEWAISAKEVTDKGLISKMYKHLLQLNTKKTKKPCPKMGRSSKQTVLQRDIQMAKKTTWKDVQQSLIIREM